MGMVATKSKTDDYERAKDIVSTLSMQLLRLHLYFQWYLFQRLRVYYAPKMKSIMKTNGYSIFLSPSFLDLPPSTQLFILRHELYHVAFRHPEQLRKRLERTKTLRERNLIDIAHNVIADAIVNDLIVRENSALGVPTPTGFVTVEPVNRLIEGDVVKLGYSNAIDKLLYLVWKGVIEVNVYADGKLIDIGKVPVSALIKSHRKVVAELYNKRNNAVINIVITMDHNPDDDVGPKTKIKDSAGGKGPETPEELEKLIKDAVAFDKFKRASEGLKTAGRGVLGDTFYELEDVVAKKPEWEAKLTTILTSFLSRHAVVSWHFVNRRAPFTKPGIKYLSHPDMHILLDVSTSMLDGTLTRALKRILYIIENYPDVRTLLYQWSSVASLPEEIDTRFARDLKKYKKLRVKTGGTELEPALDIVLRHVKPTDSVIILTDGYISDIDKESVGEKLRRLAKLAGLVVFASLGYIPENLPPLVEKVKLED